MALGLLKGCLRAAGHRVRLAWYAVAWQRPPPPHEPLPFADTEAIWMMH